ncbi:MAG TPA: 1,2-phenylacetyl-CoA epoxidase subunit PaaD [Gemmatimonadaceae bacterium]|nr:1,2-phenylacetyl-CoA epoxidase subunit PaaD [Gemmatimonadaceae bacterium]
MTARPIGAIPTRDEILAILDTVMDPEVPVLSVRELGIIRDVEVSAEGRVTVTVTPTYSGCPAIRVIEQDIVRAIEVAGFTDVQVRTALAPAWTTDWIDPEARAKLKAYGIAPPGRVESGELVQLLRHRPATQCPYCDSYDTELRSEFGSTACKSVCWCRSCRQPFEEFKTI